MTSDSYNTFLFSMRHTDNLMKGTKTTVGRPTLQEVSMFVASVALTYGAWESYIEDLAIEAVGHLAPQVAATAVPKSARAAIEAKKPSAWEISVHPGWRELWIEGVKSFAKGDGGAVYGINTAGESQIGQLSNLLGIDLLSAATAQDLLDLADLIVLRGQVVHTATQDMSFNKSTAKKYRDLVVKMSQSIDGKVAVDVQVLTGSSPW